MQTAKGRNGSSDPHQRVSPRAVRQLKTSGLESYSASPSNQARTPKERSPKVIERRSPRSPVSEKHPSRISELESQILQLQGELKRAKDRLTSSESCKEQALEDAEESKRQLLAMSSNLDELQKQILELSTSGEAHVIELQRMSGEQDKVWQSELEAVRQKHSVNSTALASAMSEIQQLKAQLESVAESGATQNKHTQSADEELQILKANLINTLSLVENMKHQLRDSKESENHAKALASETLLQLEAAKKSVEALQSDGLKATEAYDAVALELDQSRARVNLLEGLVSKLKMDMHDGSNHISPDCTGSCDTKQMMIENGQSAERSQLEAEICLLKSEVQRLRSALEAAEVKYHEKQIHSTVQIRSVYEQVEQIKTGSIHREAELDAELKKARSDIEDLKAELMDKETELQGILEENEGLNMKLKKSLSYNRETELEGELKKLKENLANLNASLMDKETEQLNLLEENENLKEEISKKAKDRGKADDHAVVELDAAKAAEREALTKLEIVMEEMDRSNKWVARVTEQLEAAQAANSEMEAELRRIKVQSNQWRKAAEAAAAMLSSGNNGKFMERTGSMDSNSSTPTKKISSLYGDDMDDDLLKKRNGSMLKKIGGLWRKPQNRTS
uniref:Interactor of constitutive active ROPs 3 n=1 Tax=Rhizophora mucronata TaxID=61149 RepID=A0A2P2JZD0_RHIMU